MILQVVVYAMIVGTAACVVGTPDPRRAVFAFAFYGIVLALFFLVMQAPDVALSEIAVGSAAVPFVTLVTLTRMKEK